MSPARTTLLIGDLGVTQQDGVRVPHSIQNLKFNSQFNTHELFISGIFHSKFTELCLLQVTETSESRAVDKGVTGLSILCPKLFLRHQGTRKDRGNHSLQHSGRGRDRPNPGHWLSQGPPGSHGLQSRAAVLMAGGPRPPARPPPGQWVLPSGHHLSPHQRGIPGWSGPLGGR